MKFGGTSVGDVAAFERVFHVVSTQLDKKPVITPLEASGLIDRTGGKSFYATDKSYDALFQSLAEDITASYAIAIYPANGGGSDAKPRRVTIQSKSGFTVRQNRSEYKAK